jgi:serine protease Do
MTSAPFVSALRSIASSTRLAWLFGFALALVICLPATLSAGAADVVAATQPKIVKIYGAGGIRGLEAYQSGLLISGEGHVLTVWSYVLDTEEIIVTLYDGRRHKAELLGSDPRLELAVLKIDAADLEHFDLDQSAEASEGTRVLAFSNLFGVATGDEAASVQKGVVSARTNLAARRGAFETPYRGSVYVLDAMTNNPGAAGGALVNYDGRLLGVLGKELRNALNNTWLNYALPVDELRESVAAMQSGKFIARNEEDQKPEQSLQLSSLGIVLVPDVLSRTPPFIDEVRRGSPAQRAGLKSDDLLVFVNGRIVPSCKALVEELEFVEPDARVQITVVRGQELVEVELTAAAAGAKP